ncbi:hypothetical protein BJ508DRAFT_419180 [Ascobolus immersus RN42]|uniref:Uncharacterized protein n=1 Tax=Ascobolus immersus RN42 TaxID=1160509 RepID=A0A3N4HLX0_ASCIM|nr:hypothetical protein BJ508DRAFT_419180 [Ascobolus immersus RN42]
MGWGGGVIYLCPYPFSTRLRHSEPEIPQAAELHTTLRAEVLEAAAKNKTLKVPLWPVYTSTNADSHNITRDASGPSIRLLDCLKVMRTLVVLTGLSIAA